jgi:predicted ABC-type ATPase
LLPIEHPECTFLNADEIQREGPQFSSPIAAGRELLGRLAIRISAGESFALETTLSSGMYARQISSWRAHSFEIWLYFLQVESADFAVGRVAQRVAAGGHGIPEHDIRRRYTRGIALFPTYRALADAWYHLRVDQKGLTLVGHQTVQP